MQAASRLTSDMSIHIPVHGNIESDLSTTNGATNGQKPKGPAFLSKRCFHTSHAGITERIADVWEGLRSDGCCLQTPERATKISQGNTAAE